MDIAIKERLTDHIYPGKLIEEGETMQTISAKIPGVTLDRLMQQAAEENRPLSAVIRDILVAAKHEERIRYRRIEAFVPVSDNPNGESP